MSYTDYDNNNNNNNEILAGTLVLVCLDLV